MAILHTDNLSTWGEGAEESEDQGHPGLHHEFEDSLGYIRPLKKSFHLDFKMIGLIFS